jgi:protoporphyrinogen IX oxidase
MLWLKALHIVAIVTWFAGLFYLPRLYVYHCDTRDAAGNARFKVMERRLFFIMSLGALFSVMAGLMMVVENPAYLALRWLQVKLILVAILIGYHIVCYRLLLDFAADKNRRRATWYRAFNEIPTLLLLAIVILAVVKPF